MTGLQRGEPWRSLHGMLVAFGATPRHCTFYLMSSTTVAAHRELLAGYETTKGTVHFQTDKPLPAALVRVLVKARIEENLAGGGQGADRGRA